MDNTLAELRNLLLDKRNVLIVSHKNPDGDAIGSALGLQKILSNLGHEVKVAVPDDSPSFLKWLPGHKEILIFDRKSTKEQATQWLEVADLIFCVDFNSPDRLGEMEDLFKLSKGFKILIDHHPSRELFADLSIVDASRGSTSELIYKVTQDLGFTECINEESATCLLAGILTDTVGFKVSCSYPEIFETVAGLMRLGAEKDRIQDEVYNQFSSDRMRLLGYSLRDKMVLKEELHSAYISLTRSELRSYHHKKGDTEGFVNYPLSISRIKFSVLFTEQEDHIKLSLRSRGDFPANEFAQKHFLGGGHKNAAGGRFFGSMADALAHFENVLLEYRDLLIH